ncbi:MAG: redoxin domain-containing protein [Proteobacteria bacterium]|nr:redoxin domain-containing protein [Pseudomonadota bacterium]MCP4916765.1 redoxin domain-containing protein [Pseudomonadota bacterium]
MLLLSLACNPFSCDEGELLLADGTCIPNDGSGGDDPSDSDDTEPLDSDSGGETDPPAEWTTLPADCTAPSDVASDPLTMTGSYKLDGDGGSGRFLEALDVEIIDGMAHVVGQGGMAPFDISDPTDPQFQGWVPDNGDFARYHKVEALDDGLIALTNRESGIYLTEVGSGQLLGETLMRGAEGMLWHDEVLYVAVRGEGIFTYEVFSGQLAETGRVEGLGAPWEFSKAVDGWTYIADNSLGVVPVDLSGDEPVIGTPVGLDAPALDVTVDGDWLYVAAGGQGVVVLDRSTPSAPTVVATVGTGGSAVMTAVHEDVLWVSDHEGVVIFDISDPTDPKPLHREVTEQFALAITSDPATGLGWVGDWNILSGWSYDSSITAPALDLPSTQIVLSPDGGAATTTITNRGAGTLELAGATIGSSDVTVEVSSTSVAPGETVDVRLTYGAGGELETTLCLASNDPTSPTLDVGVLTNDNEFIGTDAPDFRLEDLDGNTYKLSEYSGHPVVLVYFATW